MGVNFSCPRLARQAHITSCRLYWCHELELMTNQCSSCSCVCTTHSWKAVIDRWPVQHGNTWTCSASWELEASHAVVAPGLDSEECAHCCCTCTLHKLCGMSTVAPSSCQVWDISLPRGIEQIADPSWQGCITFIQHSGHSDLSCLPFCCRTGIYGPLYPVNGATWLIGIA